MPTYEYKCDNCGSRFDKFQSIKAAPLRRCPSCGKNALQRLIGTGAGVIFKGSGFYATDYRSESYKEKAKAESGTIDSKSADGSKTGDTKSTDAKSPVKSDAPATNGEASTPAKEKRAQKTTAKPSAKD